MSKGIKAIKQAGVYNFLGKQKMITVPIKWKSGKDHPDTELAYITKPEKELLIKLDLHGSMKDGKPNKGPGGIISLNSGGSGDVGADSAGPSDSGGSFDGTESLNNEGFGSTSSGQSGSDGGSSPTTTTTGSSANVTTSTPTSVGGISNLSATTQDKNANGINDEDEDSFDDFAVGPAAKNATDPDPNVDKPVDTGLSFMNNLAARTKAAGFANLVPGMGAFNVVRAAIDTEKMRNEMGITSTPPADTDTRGGDSGASSSLGTPPLIVAPTPTVPPFFNLGIQPNQPVLNAPVFSQLGNPYNYQNPNLYRFNKGGIVDVFSWYCQ
jgi:hypothetical protein